MALSLGFPEHNGNSSNREIVITVPAVYDAGLSALYGTVPHLFYLLSIRATAKDLDFCRRQIIGAYRSVEWDTLAAFATSVFNHKQRTLRGTPSLKDWNIELLEWKRIYQIEQRGY